MNKPRPTTPIQTAASVKDILDWLIAETPTLGSQASRHDLEDTVAWSIPSEPSPLEHLLAKLARPDDNAQ